MKEYEKLDEIPRGKADLSCIRHGCLVLEGGALRGLYTQGALDALMEEGIILDCCIGVSAGALSGMEYMSGQIGLSATINLKYRHDPRYFGIVAMKDDKGPTGFSYAFNELFDEVGYDMDAFMNSPRRFVAVATNIKTGLPTFFEKGKCSDMLQAIRASATVPYVSSPVTIDNEQYLDGGLGVRVPYEWALNEGYKKIIVIRTRDKAYRKKKGPRLLIKSMYKKYPEAMKDLVEETPRYNISLDKLDMLEEKKRLYVIAPSRPVTIKRFEDDLDKLADLYWLGYNDVKNEVNNIKAYLDK